MKRLYLDYAATTPTRPDVVAAMQPYFSEVFGYPSSIYFFGQESKGAVEEAAATTRTKGVRVATLHFAQVWPLVPEHFIDMMQSAKEVVAVEGNAFGQLARLIRRETGFYIERFILRYDGLPITPEFILRALKQ